MACRKNGLKKHLSKLWLTATLIFFATTLVGTGTAQAEPVLTVCVIDSYTGKPIEGATVSLYDYSSPYDHVSTKVTDDKGCINFSVDAGSYYIFVSHSEYHDTYTSRYVGTSDINTSISLTKVRYYGSVKTAAWTKQPSLYPGSKGTLEISIYNENGTYPITLLNISIRFPWYGFYGGQWIGNETVLDDKTVEVEANGSWSYSLPFNVPKDSRAYSSTMYAVVAFNATAKAWKQVVTMTTDGPAYEKNPELTTVTITPLEYPGSIWNPDFKTTPIISIGFPTTDKSVSDSLFLVQILLIIATVCLAALLALNFRASRRLGQ